MIRGAATLDRSTNLNGVCLWMALFAGVSLAGVCGCSQVPFEAAEDLSSEILRQSSAVPALAKADAIEHSKLRELMRQLGVVSIGHESTERFEIHNDSESPWTFKTVHVNCSCTTTRQTASVILPNQSESIYVRYKAGSRTSDEHRSVIVEFHESTAPVLKLSLKAQVRKLLTAAPNELVVSACAHVIPTVDTSIELLNFGQLRWQAVDAHASVDWLQVILSEPRTSDGTPKAGEPLQRWRVQIVADATGLAEGSYSGVIHFSCPEDSHAQEAITVQMNVDSPIRIFPNSLFFGECREGSTYVQRVRVICHPAFAHVDVSASQIHSTLSDGLQMTWERPSERVWTLNAELCIRKSGSELVDEFVEVTFNDNRLGVLRIPVRAIVTSESVWSNGDSARN